MTTEEQLIYTIWDIVRGAESNQDDNINERLMRQFLQIHRGRTLETAYKKGALIDEECFQSLGNLSFTKVGTEFVNTTIPKIIRLRHSYGLMFYKDGYMIPVLNSLEFENAAKDRFNKYHPKLKFINRKLSLYLGQELDSNQIEDKSYSSLNITVRKLLEEAKLNTISINGLGILVNPDDEIGYDWTSSTYPMPDQLIENMINSVNAREFNIFLKMSSDETGDNRANSSEFNTREEL